MDDAQEKERAKQLRRRISDGEYAFYRAHAPRPVPLAQLVRVAGSWWRIEDGFAGGKELAALRRASGPQLDLLAPVDHVGPAGRRVLVRPGRRRARQQSRW